MVTLTELGFRAMLCAMKRGKVSMTAPLQARLNKQKAAIYGEANELLTAQDKPSEHIPDYTEQEEEAVDVLIASLTYLGLCGIDIDGAVEAKMNFNETRER